MSAERFQSNLLVSTSDDFEPFARVPILPRGVEIAMFSVSLAE